MATQKEIAISLDSAAISAGERGASRKQTWFLAGLMVKADDDMFSLFGNSPEPLTMKMASAYINDYLKQQKAS